MKDFIDAYIQHVLEMGPTILSPVIVCLDIKSRRISDCIMVTKGPRRLLLKCCYAHLKWMLQTTCGQSV